MKPYTYPAFVQLVGGSSAHIARKGYVHPYPHHSTALCGRQGPVSTVRPSSVRSREWCADCLAAWRASTYPAAPETYYSRDPGQP